MIGLYVRGLIRQWLIATWPKISPLHLVWFNPLYIHFLGELDLPMFLVLMLLMSGYFLETLKFAVRGIFVSIMTSCIYSICLVNIIKYLGLVIFSVLRYNLDIKLKEIFRKENIFRDELRSNYVTVRDPLAHKIGILYNRAIRFDIKLNHSNAIE